MSRAKKIILSPRDANPAVQKRFLTGRLSLTDIREANIVPEGRLDAWISEQHSMHDLMTALNPSIAVPAKTISAVFEEAAQADQRLKRRFLTDGRISLIELRFLQAILSRHPDVCNSIGCLLMQGTHIKHVSEYACSLMVTSPRHMPEMTSA